MGYVDCADGVTDDWLASGRMEVEVAWKCYPVKAQLRPWYDPKGSRARG
jgi:4-methylaminobutanoate oxidase (formaldehyde-forming)